MSSKLNRTDYHSKEPVSTSSYEGSVEKLHEVNSDADPADLKLFAVSKLMTIKDRSTESKTKKAQSTLLSTIKRPTEALPASSSNARPEQSRSPKPIAYNLPTTNDTGDNVIFGNLHFQGSQVQLEPSSIRKNASSDDL